MTLRYRVHSPVLLPSLVLATDRLDVAVDALRFGRHIHDTALGRVSRDGMTWTPCAAGVAKPTLRLVHPVAVAGGLCG